MRTKKHEARTLGNLLILAARLHVANNPVHEPVIASSAALLARGLLEQAIDDLRGGRSRILHSHDGRPYRLFVDNRTLALDKLRTKS